MLLKAGVDISRLNREIRRALKIAERVYSAYGELFVVTSTYEGTHSAGSLHYANDAFDSNDPKFKREEILGGLVLALGQKFDVVREVDHIHIEYDPK